VDSSDGGFFLLLPHVVTPEMAVSGNDALLNYVVALPPVETRALSTMYPVLSSSVVDRCQHRVPPLLTRSAPL
jgi:hypothetical protein